MADRGGIELKTFADVRAYVIALPERLQNRRHWQRVAELLLDAGDLAEELTMPLGRSGVARRLRPLAMAPKFPWVRDWLANENRGMTMAAI